MIDERDKLTVKLDASGFSDLSSDAADYSRDSFNITMIMADYLYVGLDKPFGSIFAALETANSNSGNLNFEIYNGDNWVAPSFYNDESRGFNRSGFLFWGKTSMKSTTIDGIEKYYIRLSISADSTAMVFRGINLVLSDDSRMKVNFPPINSTRFYPEGESTHLITHVSARDEIIMRLRKRYRKRNNDLTDVWSKINIWDLIDLFELREAATYLALAKTFFNISDNLEDHWYDKYKHWEGKYQSAFETAYLSIDIDDDGEDDEEEIQKTKESASLYR